MAKKILEWDIASPPGDVPAEGYPAARVLVWWERTPLGTVDVDAVEGVFRAEDVRQAIVHDDNIPTRLNRTQALRWLMRHDRPDATPLPSWTVVICTRDRTDDLRMCLASLAALDRTGGEVLVVDNAPSTDATRRLVEATPGVRYVLEPTAGLNHARARGAREATGEVVLYIDDDVRVEPEWVRAALRHFREPRVGAVTGMVMPAELETPAQEMFEVYGGLGRGFDRRVFSTDEFPATIAGATGAGANMAVRRELILGLGLFDAELDCGSVTKTGGDAYAFYLLLSDGHKIVYEPEALVWHKHRRTAEDLHKTLHNYAVGGFAYLTRVLLVHHDWSALHTMRWWLQHDGLGHAWRVLRRKRRRLTWDAVIGFWTGVPKGIRAHFASRAVERQRAAERTRPVQAAAAPSAAMPIAELEQPR